MYLSHLKIRNFRNLPKLEIKPQSLINYFYSPNGTGKTNLLEAIQCVTVGKTLRSSSENDVINFQNNKDKEDVFVFGDFGDSEGLNFSQTYFLEAVKSEEDARTKYKKKKKLLHNKTKISITEFIGRVPSIWFSPESIKIITSSPKSKREYFDDVLIQLYPDYLFNLRYFNRALKQRNKLLQEEYLKPNNIRIWTEQLVLYGAKVINTRQRFFKALNIVLSSIDEVSRYKFFINYDPDIKVSEIFEEDTEYRYREELRSSYEADKRKASTNRGPHRDDWNMMISITDKVKEGKPEFIRADKFASRGQQRMSLIVLQLVLIKLFEKTLERKPILLLDDIFSELDEENEKILLDIIHHNTIQSFITGVEKKDFDNITEYNLKDLLA